MRLSWGRGLFRIWTVLAIIWVTFFAWREYSAHWWWSDPVFHVSGECWDPVERACWDRLAKWQDGKAFSPWDDAPDTPPGSGPVAELVGIEVGVVSGVMNLESSGVEASDWRLRHDEDYHEA